MSNAAHEHYDTILTEDDVRQWQVEKERLSAEYQRIGRELADLDRKLEAAAIIKGHTTQTGQLATEGETIATAIAHIVNASEDEWSHAQLIDELKKRTDFRERLHRNPSYYYTVVGRLVRRGAISRHGDKLGSAGKV
jgi:hypothetical protein